MTLSDHNGLLSDYKYYFYNVLKYVTILIGAATPSRANFSDLICRMRNLSKIGNFTRNKIVFLQDTVGMTMCCCCCCLRVDARPVLTAMVLSGTLRSRSFLHHYGRLGSFLYIRDSWRLSKYRWNLEEVK